MRIISDFHDYYDKAMGLGQDRETIWIRNSSEVQDVLHAGSQQQSFYAGTDHYTLKFVRIAFCGKIYPLVIGEDWSNFGAVRKFFFYSLEALEVWLQAKMKKRDWETYDTSKSRWGLTRKALEPEFIDKAWVVPATEVEPILVSEGKWSRDHKMSLMTRNACLRDFEFFRVKDPYTAFQELYAWACNRAHPNKPIPPVSDADMIIAKGFDKWSFRKPPSKKR